MANSTNYHEPKQSKIHQNKGKRQQQTKAKPEHEPESPSIISQEDLLKIRSATSKPAPSWSVIRSILSCKHIQTHGPQPQPQPQTPPKQQKLKQRQQQQQHHIEPGESSNSSSSEPKQLKKMKCSGSICSNTKVIQRPDLLSSAGSSFHTISSISETGNNVGSSSSSRSMKPPPLQEYTNQSSNSSVITSSSSYHTNNASVIPSSFSYQTNNANSNQGSGSGFKGITFRRLTGCYECKMVVDPVVLGFTRDPSLGSTVCSCPDCGEVFMKADNLEAHQAVRHAVSELGPEDTSRNIVEIIFQSSWLKKQTPVCKIDRILKVHNTPKKISTFESYRESIKSKANKTLKKHPRCIADGNELLRFHCTTLLCSLGLNGSTNLCNSIPTCSVCRVIRNGFRVTEKGILTTATSGKADDKIEASPGEKRAMLVCRVIAGRVRRGNSEEFDSVSDGLETYSSSDELYVFNQKAIMPCFVVIYGES